MTQFDWDDQAQPRGNTAHLADNDVTPDEFEQVFLDPRSRRGFSASTGRPLRRGRTAAGRDVVVVYETLCDEPPIVRPVTAYEPGD